jgi:hypothetical protein
MASSKLTPEHFRRYRTLLDELRQAENVVDDLKKQIQLLESGDLGISHANIPRKLSATYQRLRDLGGRGTLDDVYKGRSRDLSRPGVRAQLIKLVDFKLVRQVARGEFEII